MWSLSVYSDWLYLPSVGLVPTERVDVAGDLVAVHCTSSSGVPVKMVSLPVSRREFSFDFFRYQQSFFLFGDFCVLIDSSYLA